MADVIHKQVYKEEIPIPHANQQQVLSILYKAATYLQWQVISVVADGITYRTFGHLYEEYITVHIADKKLTLSVIPGNEYYHDEAVSKKNIASLKNVIQQLADKYEKEHRNMHPMHREKWGALVPSKSYMITPLLVYLNIAVFVATLIGGLSPVHPHADSLLNWGGNYRPAIEHGEIWRLFSYLFLHAGIAHLLGNTFALLYIGMFLEPLIGRFRFGAAYLLSGITAAVLSLVIHNNSVGVGASGAIFGLYGVFLALLTTNYIQRTMRKTMLRSLLFFIVYNLMMGLQGNTDNAAHMGGLIGGLLIGYAYYPGIKAHATPARQAITTLMLAIGTVMVTYCGLHWF